MRFALLQTVLLAWLVWEAVRGASGGSGVFARSGPLGRSGLSAPSSLPDAAVGSGPAGADLPGLGGSTGPEIGGVLLLTAGIALALAAYRDLGRSFRIVPEPGAGSPLVTRGVYRHLRHPMYTAAMLASFGLVCLRPSVRITLAAGTVIAFYHVKARYEEGRLRERFPSYAAHAARTFGVIPWRRGR